MVSVRENNIRAWIWFSVPPTHSTWQPVVLTNPPIYWCSRSRCSVSTVGLLVLVWNTMCKYTLHSDCAIFLMLMPLRGDYCFMVLICPWLTDSPMRCLGLFADWPFRPSPPVIGSPCRMYSSKFRYLSVIVCSFFLKTCIYSILQAVYQTYL